MKWRYVKKLNSENLINEFEDMVKYNFCDSFKQLVVKNNGGRPSNKLFVTYQGKEHAIKSFLSFNKDDKETVWNVLEYNKYELFGFIPFAIDNFGNLICFQKGNDSIVFLNHESFCIDFIANNFDAFMNNLY